MSRAFVDTSAILALLNRDDPNHQHAANTFSELSHQRSELITTSYVLVETYALLMRRFGKNAAKRFRQYFEPIFKVIWVDETMHDAGLNLLFTRPGRRLSLVDAISFVSMQKHRIGEAFAYDQHFKKEGFGTIG